MCKNKIMHSDKTIYKLIDLGLLEVKNIDLPRKVRFRERRKETAIYKVDKHCLENRTYENFINYIKDNPDTPIVQMDSVIGRKGGKVLLTIHFVNTSFSPFEKGSCEVNHELLRRILLKGTSFDDLNQNDINSYKRKKTEQCITNYNVQYYLR